MRIWRERPGSVALPILAMAALAIMLLVLPGQTVTTKYVNDLFIFLDGAYRIVWGQVPNRDFHAALGPLVYYLPAAGYLLSGSLGTAMPLGMALYVLLLAPIMAHVLSSRLRPLIALPFGAYLLLIVAVPMNLGESITALSFAMFYNRVGWAALALLLVMYLRPDPDRPKREVLDAFCAASLVLLMVYTKISYGAVGLGFLVFMLLDRKQRRWAALAMAITVGAGLMIEAVWRSSVAHIADVLLVGKVSGTLRGGLESLFDALLRNLADYVLLGLFACLALWRMRSFRDFLFYGFCAGAGLLVVNQNFQNWGIISLAAGAVVAAETLVRTDEWDSFEPPQHRSLGWGSQFLMLAFLLPTIVHCMVALGLHAALASGRTAQIPGMPNFDRIKVVDLWASGGDYPFLTRYLATLQDGASALTSLESEPSRVFVLDFVSPFSAGMKLRPPRGDSSWQHWGRTVDEVAFVAPEQLFQDVRIIMEPKWAVDGPTADGLRQLYNPYIASSFELVRETADWKVHLSRKAPGEPRLAVEAAPAR